MSLTAGGGLIYGPLLSMKDLSSFRKGIPTFSRLVDRNCAADDTMRPHGCGVDDSDVHVFFRCQVARALWFASRWSIRWDNVNSDDLIVLCHLSYAFWFI